MPELLANCDWCPWELLVWSDDEKQRKEAAHTQRFHADVTQPTTDEITRRMFAEHGDEADIVMAAIEQAARLDNGIVDQNRVRTLITPGTVRPQIIGAVYAVLKRRGYDGRRLVPAGTSVSDDRRGGNAGKPVTVYRLVDERPVGGVA